MTKLEQLIKTHCPDGVDRKTMGELGCFYGGITGKSKDDFKDGNARFITYKNVYTNPALRMDLDDFVKIDANEKQRSLEYGDVIFTGSSECIEECGLSSVVTRQPTENLYLNSFCFIFRFNNVNCMLPDFAKHLFRSQDLRYQIIKTASGVTRYNVSKEKMKKISIPVPPLPVQEEIVRILDKFTELKAELDAELDARRKQYEYYRDTLLSSCEHKVSMQNIQSLIDASLIKILTPSFKIKRNDYCANGLVPIVSQEAEYISGYCDTKDERITKRNYVCFGDHSEHIKFIDFEFVQGADGLKIMHTDENKLLTRYLYHALSNFYTRHDNYERHFKYLTDTTIPVPPIDVQQRLVNVLDNFDAICSGISIGLPAEIAVREKQYNYYRDLLFNYAADMAGFKQSRAEQSRAEQSRAEQSRAEQSRAEQSRVDEIKLIQYVFGAAQLQFGDIFDFQNGFAFKSSLFRNVGNPILRITNIQDNRIDDNGLVFFDDKDYKENLSSFLVNQGDIVIAMSGATTGKVGVNGTTKQYYLNQRVGKFIPKDGIVLNRYLYHLLSNKSEQIYKMSDNGSQPNLSSDKLKQLTVHIPSIEEQRRIVNILDRFDKLCNDISSGLPAEILAREQQYEYYREKLLTFKELSA